MVFLYFSIFVLFLQWISVNSDCGVLSKRDWGGKQPGSVEYLPRPVDLVVIQHTATVSCNTDTDCVTRAKSIQTAHMQEMKFADVGNSFLVGGNGKIYEGRGWLHVGAHTRGYNKRSIGISFMGNFNNDDPQPEALEAVKALIKCGVDHGHLSPNYRLVAHSQLAATASPGRKLFDEIKKWPNWLENVSSIKRQR